MSSKVFRFVARFIDRSTKHKRTAAIMRVHKRYSETVVSVTGDVK